MPRRRFGHAPRKANVNVLDSALHPLTLLRDLRRFWADLQLGDGLAPVVCTRPRDPAERH